MPVPTRAEQNGSLSDKNGSLSDVIPGGSVGPDEAAHGPNYGGGPTPPAE